MPNLFTDKSDSLFPTASCVIVHTPFGEIRMESNQVPQEMLSGFGYALLAHSREQQKIALRLGAPSTAAELEYGYRDRS